ncbi:STAS domain-containing protein [Mycobacterium deserti]|uniref:STAS domain-containing protein n=1 Tax=Mycobacterium deserti TaxID=2978347 RepID=A0ABT2M948_9MYCO|nr:STAS domain-containing protein [Mycobacterium deserti]MCT7658792.1 STAS domain-containing protein [Mycobacterium deserti]
MYGNPAFDCDGAQIRARCRQLATVVTISGDIGANIDRVTQFARRFVLPEKPIVLDLSGVGSFAAHCVSLFYAIDDACAAAGVEWELVTSPSVSRALSAFGDAGVFPIADSVPDALEHFADVLGERRRLLPILGKTA